MPSTPYAQLRVKVNGGAPQTGAVAIAAGDTIQFDATSYDGWTAPVARWEIYSFPDGWAGPGGAWTSESVSQADGSTYTVWYWLGNSQPPSFVAPAITYWGKYLTRLLVNDGYKGGVASDEVEDTATLLTMESATGLKDLAWRENTQAGGAKKWAKDHQANLRVIDGLLATAATPYASTPATVASGTGSAGASALYARGDHSHQLTFTTLNTILGTASAAISVNGQTLTSGGFIAPYVSTNAANPSTSGLVRGAHNTVLVAARSSANTDDVPIVSYGTDATDTATIGDSVVACMRLVVASGCDVEIYGDTQLLYTLGQNSLSVGATNGFLLTHTIGTGVGATATIKAQDGAATFDGGKLLLSAGAPGLGGLSNGVEIELETNDAATVSGVLSVKGGVFGEILGVFHDSGSTETLLALGPDDARLDTKILRLDASNITVFDTTDDFAGGTGILYLADATTEPTSITVGAKVHAFGGALQARGFAQSTLMPAVEGAAGTEDLRAQDRRAKRVTTTDATPLAAYTFALPNNAVALLEVQVVGYVPADGTSAGYKVTGTAKRYGGGAAALVGTPVTVPFEDNAAMDALLDISGNNVIVYVTGLAATTIEWFVTTNVTLMQP